PATLVADRASGAFPGRMAVRLPGPLSALLHSGIPPTRELAPRHLRPRHHWRRLHGPFYRRLRPPPRGQCPTVGPVAHRRSPSRLLQPDAVDPQRLSRSGLRAARLWGAAVVARLPAPDG